MADANIGASCILLALFCIQTKYYHQKIGYAHFLMVLWILVQIPQAVSYRNLPEILTNQNAGEIQQYMPKHASYCQLTTVAIVTLLWLAIGRLRRVQI